MTRTGIRILWVMIAVGTAARVAVAFATYGLGFDIHSLATVGAELTRDNPLQVYDSVNQGGSGIEGERLYRWPYAPGFFPWIAFSIAVEHRSPLPFHGLVQLPAILSDVAIALIVQAYLGWRGAGERVRLAAAGAVALGPIFALISGFHGQIDSVAILPAVVALIVFEGRGRELLESIPWAPARRLADWMDERGSPGEPRAGLTGALIGLGIAVKTVPAILLVALIPLARRLSEVGRMVAIAALIPLVAILPFLIADPDGVIRVADYRGAPGIGGLNLVIQPELALAWLNRQDALDLSTASQLLFDWGHYLLAAILLALAFLIRRQQLEPVDAAVLVWVAVYTFGPTYFNQYLIWGMPFFLMAGYVRQTIALQLVVIGPAILLYMYPWPVSSEVEYIYVPALLIVWAAFFVSFVLLVRRAFKRPAEATA